MSRRMALWLVAGCALIAGLEARAATPLVWHALRGPYPADASSTLVASRIVPSTGGTGASLVATSSVSRLQATTPAPSSSPAFSSRGFSPRASFSRAFPSRASWFEAAVPGTGVPGTGESGIASRGTGTAGDLLSGDRGDLPGSAANGLRGSSSTEGGPVVARAGGGLAQDDGGADPGPDSLGDGGDATSPGRTAPAGPPDPSAAVAVR